MTTEIEAARPEQGISSIFLLLIAAFAIAGAALAAGDAGGVIVFVFVFIGWIISLCLHEWGHAATAWAGGDHSVQERGYLTLNPLRYANPLMSIILPLLFLAMGGIGFPGGAVYVHPERLRGPIWRAAMSAAGPAMNLACLVVIALFLSALGNGDHVNTFVAALSLLAFLQATALLLNLLPVPGLDGFGILEAALPPGARAALAPLSRLTLIVFFTIVVAMPQLLDPLWGAALGLCAALGVEHVSIVEGFSLFRFWITPSGPFGT